MKTYHIWWDWPRGLLVYRHLEREKGSLNTTLLGVNFWPFRVWWDHD